MHLDKEEIISNIRYNQQKLRSIDTKGLPTHKPIKPTRPYIQNPIKPPFFHSIGCGFLIVWAIFIYIDLAFIKENYIIGVSIFLAISYLIYSTFTHAVKMDEYRNEINKVKAKEKDYDRKLSRHHNEYSKYLEYIELVEKKKELNNKIKSQIDDLMKLCTSAEKDKYSLEFLGKPYQSTTKSINYRDAFEMEFLKSIGHEVPYYYQNSNSIKKRTSPPIISDATKNKVQKVILTYSAICAGLAIQPLPFADIFVLTPTQAIMGKKIADAHGYSISEASANEVVKEIIGVIGMGVIAQQLAIGAYKTFLPFLGAVTTIPLVFGLTYSIGKVMDYYFQMKIQGKQPDKDIIKSIFKSSLKTGKEEGRKRESEIKDNHNHK